MRSQSIAKSTKSAPAAAPPLRRLFSGATGRVYLLLCLMLFFEYIDRVNLSVAAPIIKAEMDLSNTQLGLALSAFGYCYATLQIVNGYVGDRIGARLALTWCGMAWAMGTIATGWAGGLGSLIVARMLVGLGEAGTIPMAARVISNWVPSNRRAFAQGFTHSCARLAAGVTPPIVVALTALFGWRAAFSVLGIVSLAWAAAWFAYFRNDPREHKGVTRAELADLPESHAPHRSLRALPAKRLLIRILPTAMVFFCRAWTL